MKTLETVYFCEKRYLKRLHKQDISDIDLAQKIHHKRNKRLSCKTKCSVGVAVVICTAGVAAPGWLHLVRNYTVLSRKLTVLEVLWASRGPEALPQPGFLESFKRVAQTLAVEAASMGMDHLGVAGMVSGRVGGYVQGKIDAAPESQRKGKKQKASDHK